MIPDELYKKIEAYLKGELKESEKKAFEAAMTKDPELALEVQIQRDIEHAASAADALTFESLVKEVQTERKKEKKNKRPLWLNQRYMLAIAAGLALLVVAYLIWNRSESLGTYTPDELYTEFVDLDAQQHLLGYEKRQVRGGPIGGEDSTKTREIEEIRDKLSKADQLYQQKKYVEAERMLDSLLSHANPTYFSQSDVRYNLGMIDMYLEKWEEAIQAFSAVTGDTKNKAEWYTAMAYIKLDQLESASQLLEKISSDRLHPKREAAMDVLRFLTRN